MPPETAQPRPLILPLGDEALLVRFGDRLTDDVNAAAIAFATRADAAAIPGVVEIVPNLASVLLRYDPAHIEFDRLAGEVRLLQPDEAEVAPGATHSVRVTFDGEDISELTALTGLSVGAFVAAHNATPLRVLATGFAPGFIYCGMHPPELHVARRPTVRRQVPAGTVLFAAGQTAITSTVIPTGWHIIGRTAFRNYHPAANPPTTVRAGDTIRFEAAP
ncbi:MAG: 5-oxoprolinase subunit B family protein [Devosia sp.]